LQETRWEEKIVVSEKGRQEKMRKLIGVLGSYRGANLGPTKGQAQPFLGQKNGLTITKL